MVDALEGLLLHNDAAHKAESRSRQVPPRGTLCDPLCYFSSLVVHLLYIFSLYFFMFGMLTERAARRDDPRFLERRLRPDEDLRRHRAQQLEPDLHHWWRRYSSSNRNNEHDKPINQSTDEYTRTIISEDEKKEKESDESELPQGPTAERSAFIRR